MGKRGSGGASAGGTRKKKKDTKAEQVEVRTAGQGELKMPAPDRQVFYFDAIKHENDQIANAKGRLKKVLDAAEAENVDTTSIKEALKLEKGDAVKYRRKYEQLAQILHAKGNPFQLTIHDIAFDSPADQAKFEARAAAKAGNVMDCRWPEGSPEHVAYVAEYQMVQASMVPGAADLTDEELQDALRSPPLKLVETSLAH